jgi:AcrR family transcriptional regulator
MPSPTNATPRAERLGPARRRPLVLDAALRVLVAEDSGDVSMDAIAEAAGVTKPVLYACFPNKGELFKALLDREEQRMLAHMAAVIPGRPNLEDPGGGLRTGFAAFLTAVTEQPDSWRLMLLAERGSNPEIRRRLARGRKVQVEALRRLVKAQYETRGVPAAGRKAELVARAIVATGEAAAAMMLDEPDRWPVDDLADLLARLTLDGAARL